MRGAKFNEGNEAYEDGVVPIDEDSTAIAYRALEDVMAWLGFEAEDHHGRYDIYTMALARERTNIFDRATY